MICFICPKQNINLLQNLLTNFSLIKVVTMESVRGINVPMYTTLRRTTVAFTMIAEYLLTGQTHSPFVVTR